MNSYLSEFLETTIHSLENLRNNDVCSEFSCIIKCEELGDYLNSDIRYSSQYKDLFKKLMEIKGPVLYWYEIMSDHTGDDIINALREYGQKENHRAIPVFYKYNNSQQNFNKIIKNVCKKAGITQKILVERTEGFKVVRKLVPKYQLVSTHTARRSGATNMYLAGIPPFRIMLITGHKTESAFYRYIRIQKEENAKDLQNHPFFK